MQKIMFNDKYGLTKAVLEGRKTMTRRICSKGAAIEALEFDNWSWAKYYIGEVVAVAQPYRDIRDIIGDVHDGKSIKFMPGWSNKKFVKADLMPHRIRITNVRVERLQDITSGDALREGIYCDYENLQYSFPTEIGYCGQYPFGTARSAFAALIDKISGKGTFDSNPWVFVYEFELVK